MIRDENHEEAAEIEGRIRALSQGIDALKNDALSLFVAHRHQENLRDRLVSLIQGLDDAWQGCSLDAVVQDAMPLCNSTESRPPRN